MRRNPKGVDFSMLNNSKPPNTSCTHNIDNRLLTAGTISFGYDDNGNLITKTLGSSVTNYSWDFNDMLNQLTAGTNTYTYRYDGLGNRVVRVENGVEKRYVFGLAETDANGNITAYYVYGNGLISKITPANESYFYHFDGLGSTIAITDSSGNVVNRYAYDEHGKVLNQEEAISNPFKYVGRFGVMDEGNGLLYMRARFYDPEVGRFISKDPIGFAGGDLNLYAYVFNNPVNEIDPLGLYSFDDFINGAGNASSGFANTITFGGVGRIQGWLGIDSVVDRCSGWYKGGEYGGYAWWAAAGLAAATRAGVSAFAHGGPNWHIGLELPGKLNLIHLGNAAGRGIHMGIGYVGPYTAWFHFYFWPIIYTWPPIWR